MPNTKNERLKCSRYQCFTINNPTDNDDKQLCDLIANTRCVYLCYGREGADKTAHYQGYIEFTKPCRFSWLKKRLKRAHWESRKGSRTQARNYCFKEDKKPFEHGKWKPDKQGERNDLVVVKRLLEEGVDHRDIAAEHFESYCKYNKFFKTYADWHQEERSEPTEVYIFWGPTGTGKTREAHLLSYDAKQIDYMNGFFEDPGNADVLIFDDVANPVRLLGRRLFLRITDRYPMKVNIKGGHANWAPKKIVFTTNENPEDWNLDEACKRRIKKIVYFGEDKASAV